MLSQLNSLRGSAEAPAVDFLRLNKQNPSRGTIIAFLTPKRYNEHPRPFLMGVPPSGV